MKTNLTYCHFGVKMFETQRFFDYFRTFKGLYAFLQTEIYLTPQAHKTPPINV